MVNETCDRCDISGEKAQLFDVIYEGKMAKLCERCAIIENILIIKKPDSVQLKESQRSTDVYDRMKRMSGYCEPIKGSAINRGQRIKELEKNPRLQLPIKQQLNLIDHFHWEIMKNRRRKGLSHRQLAEAISESELAIDILEKGKLPENSEGLIKKLEQYFQINLRKISDAEVMITRKEKMIRTKPVLLDENGNELSYIPEEEVAPGEESEIYLETREVIYEKKEIPWYKKILGRKRASLPSEDVEDSKLADSELKESNIIEKSRTEKNFSIPGSRYLSYRQREAVKNQDICEEKPTLELKEGEDLNLENVDMSNVRIGDLKEVHKKKIEATKSEQIIEQRKIEERQRMIQARKEELRLKKEKESKNIDNFLGGSELLGKKKPQDGFDKPVNEFDDELV